MDAALGEKGARSGAGRRRREGGGSGGGAGGGGKGGGKSRRNYAQTPLPEVRASAALVPLATLVHLTRQSGRSFWRKQAREQLHIPLAAGRLIRSVAGLRPRRGVQT